jgi:hypothetical protein
MSHCGPLVYAGFKLELHANTVLAERGNDQAV